jgi:hypothetical protein
MVMAFLTLNDIKDWLGISGNEHDTVLNVINAAMEQAVINYCETDFVKHENQIEVLDGNKSDVIITRETPIIAVNEIKYNVNPDGTGGDVIDASQYQVLPEAIIVPNLPTPRYRARIRVDYDWGYDGLPDDVKLCMLQAVEAEFRRKGKKSLGGGSRSKKDESETMTNDSSSWDKKTGLPTVLVAKLTTYKRFEFPTQPMAQRNW